MTIIKEDQNKIVTAHSTLQYTFPDMGRVCMVRNMTPCTSELEARYVSDHLVVRKAVLRWCID